MKNLHRINSVNLTDEQKLAIAYWFKAKRFNESRVKIVGKKLYYWISTGWREFTNISAWAGEAPAMNVKVADFHMGMVIVGEENEG